MRVARRILGAMLVVAVYAAVGFAQANLWADQITFFVESNQERAIDLLNTGDAHLYGAPFDAGHHDLLVASGLTVASSYGRAYYLLLNPALDDDGNPFFESDGSFNATAIREVREGILYLIDRSYIVEDILGDLGEARWTVLDPWYPSYAEALQTTRALELKYGYDRSAAEQLIVEGLTNHDAIKPYEEWLHSESGRPITLTVLTPDSGDQSNIGDYVVDQLEQVGFRVERQYESPARIALICLDGEPDEGAWNICLLETAPDSTARDQTADYSRYVTMTGRNSWIFEQALPVDAFTAFDTLSDHDYDSIEERIDLLGSAESLAAEAAWCQWLCSRAALWAWPEEIHVAFDLTTGVADSLLWAHTVYREDESGDRIASENLRVALPNLLDDPWNPIDGSTATGDRMIQRATEDWFVYPDPNSGRFIPYLVSSAEVMVVDDTLAPATEGSDDWITVESVPAISVPSDAWADWDAWDQRFVRCEEKHPEGIDARSKTTIVFANELLCGSLWHDGSEFSVADMLMHFILLFDRAREGSPFYDESAIDLADDPNFKAVRIANADPLTLIIYHDTVYDDAGAQVYEMGCLFWPYYGSGMAPWHTLAVGLYAEEQQTLAFSIGKADILGTDVQNWIGDGESSEFLQWALNEASYFNYNPYENCVDLAEFMGDYDPYDRYSYMTDFFDTYGHLWIGNGPMLISSIDREAKTVIGERFEDYGLDLENLRFAAPNLAQLALAPEGDSVEIGDRQPFIGTLSYEDGTPCREDEIEKVTFVVFNEEGEVALCGDGDIIGDGLIAAYLTEDDTAVLRPGPWHLEVIVVLRTVAKTASDMVGFYAE